MGERDEKPTKRTQSLNFELVQLQTQSKQTARPKQALSNSKRKLYCDQNQDHRTTEPNNPKLLNST